MQKILILAANPKNTNPLRLNEELREIKEGMRQAGERQQFLIESAEAVRTRDIHRSILNVKPNIIHFSGHGSGEQGLVFEDETGNAKLVDAAALARLFKLFASDVKCIVLNACYSETQAEAIAQHIDYVIGMSQAIGDKAAIEFAVGFYDALGAGRSIEFAYELGCSVIQIAGISESLTPKLLTKKQLNLQPSNQTLPSFSESLGSGQRVTVYKPPAPSNDLSSDRGGDYTQPEIVQSPQTDDLSSDHNEQEAQRVQQYENNLRRYEQELSVALKAGYPLDEFVRNGLKQFQQSLGIRHEDVMAIEQQLLAPKQAEYERQQEAIKRKNEQVILEHQRQQAELKEQQQRKPSPLISNSDDDLSSDCNLDYTRLRDLLKAGNWKDADYETSLVMLKGVGRKQGDWIRREELLNFPCTDLRTIDSLWVKYSSGRFGFSVQKNIYLEVGGKPGGEFHTEAFEKFIDRVGWGSGGGLWMKKEWSSLEQVTFDIDTSAPVGYLPSPVFILQGGSTIGMIGSLSSPSSFWEKLRVTYTLVAIGSRQIKNQGNVWGSYWGAIALFFSRIQACKM